MEKAKIQEISDYMKDLEEELLDRGFNGVDVEKKDADCLDKDALWKISQAH